MWLTIIRPFLPHILAFVLGFGGAWKIQDYRITGVEQEHTAYIQEQTKLAQEVISNANERRDKSAKDYQSASQDLAAQVVAGDVYRRCVAAGRCGVRVIANCPAAAVQTTERTDAASANAISTTGEPAEKLANECAATTLMLNSLQRDIEVQPGY